VRLSGILPELRIGAESRLIAEEMMQTPIGQLSEREWTRRTAADLRRFLVREMEHHIERRLQTAPLLEAL
jgi:DNA repair protein RecO (recombination protein O)